MPYRLHVTAGPSLDLSTHSAISVNDEDHPTEIQSAHFRGRITVRVKDFPGSRSQPPSSSDYFKNKRVTFSLQCQGQYGDPLQPNSLSADDLMFGIVLREPLSDTPPLGLTLIERVMRWFWPNMESNLRNSSPWILSPLFATMSRIHLYPRPVDQERSFDTHPRPIRPLPPWPGIIPDAESENAIGGLRSGGSSADSPPGQSQIISGYSGTHTPPDAKSRKKHFSSREVRRSVRIDPSDTVTTIFHNSFIDFRDLSLAVPGVPMRIELGKYMIGKPAQYVCRNREGDVFWAIVFTILRDE